MSLEAIPMRLHCPECGALHIDEGEFSTKLHHTHACQSCGAVWRPAVEHTVGVRFLPGFKNAAISTPNQDAIERMPSSERSAMAAMFERELDAAKARADEKDAIAAHGLYGVDAAGKPVQVKNITGLHSTAGTPIVHIHTDGYAQAADRMAQLERNLETHKALEVRRVKMISALNDDLFQARETIKAAWKQLDHAVDGQPYWSEPGLDDTQLADAIGAVLQHYRGALVTHRTACAANEQHIAELREDRARLQRWYDDLKRINDNDIPTLQRERDEAIRQREAYAATNAAGYKRQVELKTELAAAQAKLKAFAENDWLKLDCANPSQPQVIICAQIIEERRAQDRQWGGKNHDDNHNRSEWCEFVADHLGRAKKAQSRFVSKGDQCDADEYRKQMIEIAALAMAAIESHDRKNAR